MSAALEGAVELLERSLAYTSATLGGVDERPGGNLGSPTPCGGWDLATLLRHMDDALDAFTEAAAGVVAVHPGPLPLGPPARVERLRTKACVLLGAWLGAPAGQVEVGGAHAAAPLLVATAALEITVHGWDVGQAVARPGAPGAPVPPALAVGLLGVARGVLRTADRPGRFAAARTTGPTDGPGEHLLAYLGRTTPCPDGPPGSFRRQAPPSGLLAP